MVHIQPVGLDPLLPAMTAGMTVALCVWLLANVASPSALKGCGLRHRLPGASAPVLWLAEAGLTGRLRLAVLVVGQAAALLAMVLVCAGLYACASPWSSVDAPYLLAAACVIALGLLLAPCYWLRALGARRRRLVLLALPCYLDLIALCGEAGLGMRQALEQAVAHGPAGPLHTELQRLLLDLRCGQARATALLALTVRLPMPGIRELAVALGGAGPAGGQFASTLLAQADFQRAQRFQRAEMAAAAMPVKLLLPLAVCFVPCTFIVLAFPIVMKFLHPEL